jgi:hypothetical protein
MDEKPKENTEKLNFASKQGGLRYIKICTYKINKVNNHIEICRSPKDNCNCEDIQRII